MGTDTVVGCFLDKAEADPSRPIWYQGREGRWAPVTWGSARDQVRLLAAGLASLGVSPEERVGLVGPNCPEWVIADYAIQLAGGVVVPMYDTSPPDQIERLLNRTGARICLAYGEEILGRLRETQAPRLEQVIALHLGDEEHDRHLGLGGVTERGERWLEANPHGLEERLAAVSADQIATIVFTSGTSGEVKGAALTHANLVFAADAAARAVGVRPRERTLSYLPLAHSFERVVTTVIPVIPATDGWTCWFVEDLTGLPAALRSVRPTIFIGVPVVWARMQERILAEIGKKGVVRRGLARLSLAAGDSVVRHRDQGTRPRGIATLGARVARLLGRRILRRIGLGRCWYAVSGAAPLLPQTQRFFQTLGLPLHQGWGLTETAALCTVQRPDDLEVGVVGAPLEGVRLRLGMDGEVLVRGPNVFVGYEGEPAGSPSPFDEDGFLRTGDVGRLAGGDRLVIVDRVKDVIITAGGRKVAPGAIEEQLRGDPLIDGAMVLGEGRPYLVALISVHGKEATRLVGGEHGADEAVWEHPKVRQGVDRAVTALNRSLPEAERIRRHAILPFGFPDRTLTPTLKLKRRVVEETFNEVIESLYV